MVDEPSAKRPGYKHWSVQVVAALCLGYIGLHLYENIDQYNKAPLPVKVTYRDAMLGPGYVAQVRNESPRYLAVVATLKNPTTGQMINSRLDLPPDQIVEIGHAEGWPFASGDTITLVHADYRDWSGSIP